MMHHLSNDRRSQVLSLRLMFVFFVRIITVSVQGDTLDIADPQESTLKIL